MVNYIVDTCTYVHIEIYISTVYVYMQIYMSHVTDHIRQRLNALINAEL